MANAIITIEDFGARKAPYPSRTTQNPAFSTKAHISTLAVRIPANSHTESKHCHKASFFSSGADILSAPRLTALMRHFGGACRYSLLNFLNHSPDCGSLVQSPRLGS
jgi:hypothetical protein